MKNIVVISVVVVIAALTVNARYVQFLLVHVLFLIRSFSSTP